MGKIFEFRLPDQAASGNVGFEIPVKRDNPPNLVDGINWATRAFDSRQTGLGQRQDNPPPRRQKEPIVISVMPDETFPTGHRDLRPLLQRDGLILLSWAIWEDWYNDESFLRCYIVTWVTSQGKARHYATNAVEERELEAAVPERRGDRLFYRGAHSSIGGYDLRSYSDKAIADYLYFAAPFDLDKETIPGFIRVLKALGSTVDFDHVFSLGAAKKSLAREYLDKLASTQVSWTS
jgi:hypothetical protein